MSGGCWGYLVLRYPIVMMLLTILLRRSGAIRARVQSVVVSDGSAELEACSARKLVAISGPYSACPTCSNSIPCLLPVLAPPRTANSARRALQRFSIVEKVG